MSDRRVRVEGMAEAIAQSISDYANLSNEVMKECVADVSKSIKKDIRDNAPVKSGRYKKSWTAAKQQENANTLTMVVHSRNRYQIAHLLEHGHVKRGGGRVQAIPHIAPAEQRGGLELVSKIERGISE
ncbi:HK97 gp10 family phage protein [Robinsoniella peoriensis]|uniref:HK97 gp10 family phage protein n=1 Tax=Robinsoniella peoriensis TaxID=180332 RepID=UPI0005C7D857|nr:HK97 gp10 family phage protein [Robinsoniella peoriensis]